jgi:hypothetical protein
LPVTVPVGAVSGELLCRPPTKPDGVDAVVPGGPDRAAVDGRVPAELAADQTEAPEAGPAAGDGADGEFEGGTPSEVEPTPAEDELAGAVPETTLAGGPASIRVASDRVDGWSCGGGSARAGWIRSAYPMFRSSGLASA